ncbi:MAG TPA: ATP-binding protein [Acidimicrobiales bacterium]
MTNAITHGLGTVSLTIEAGDDEVHIEVFDEDGTSLALRPLSVDTSSASGRGLMIVDNLATTWGVDVRGEGKTVLVRATALGPRSSSGIAATLVTTEAATLLASWHVASASFLRRDCAFAAHRVDLGRQPQPPGR